MARIGNRRRRRLSKAQRRERRRRQTRQTRAVRRQLRQLHAQLPNPARALVDTLGRAFTTATALRVGLLLPAALLTVGRHTIANLLRTLGPLVPGDASSYRRVFSHGRWSSWRLAHLLTAWVLEHLAPAGPVLLAGDDTVDEHRGKRVYGKGRHRDPVRSTHTYTAFRWGHKWVVVAVLVRLPGSRRLWALPVLVALYRSEDESRCRGRRHKTPPELLRQLLRVLMRWFPDRQFVCAADGNYATHDLARLAARHPERLTYVSHFYADAALYEAPPPAVPGTKRKGRPRQKGPKLPAPAAVVARAPRQSCDVAWYGGGRRAVEVVTGTGQWYRSGAGLVPLRWVWVHDGTGTHRDEYFFTTAVGWTAAQVIETYTGRWNIETTFEDMRCGLGLETTRGWTERTVLRVAPCLFGLYTVVATLYVQLPARHRAAAVVAWLGKRDVTFSDALTAVRRWLWVEWIFAIPGHGPAFSKLSRPFQQLLLAGLTPAP
jgi:DDE superfamily endonuclease